MESLCSLRFRGKTAIKPSVVRCSILSVHSLLSCFSEELRPSCFPLSRKTTHLLAFTFSSINVIEIKFLNDCLEGVIASEVETFYI